MQVTRPNEIRSPGVRLHPNDAFPWGAWPRDAAVDTHR